MLDTEIKQDLLYLSQIKNQSMSRLVRSLLREKVKEEKKRIKKTKKIDGITTLLLMAKEAERISKKYGSYGPKDGSINIDHYLYGAPKRDTK